MENVNINTSEVSIDKLVNGDLFKLNNRQRKWRKFKKKINLPNDECVPERSRGKCLVVFDNCNLYELDKSEKVIIPKH